MAKRRTGGRVPWYGKLDWLFFPFLGSAQVGPYDTPPPPSGREVSCPACHQPMSQHRRVEVGGKVRDYCPQPRPAGDADGLANTHP